MDISSLPPTGVRSTGPQRFRDRINRVRNGSTSSRAVRSQQLARVGELNLENVTVNPNPVLPGNQGGTVTVDVTIAETGQFVSPFNPNTCDPPEMETMEGIRGAVEVNPDWIEPSERVFCIAMWKQATGRERLKYSFRAPDLPQGSNSESHDIDVTLSLPGSEEVADPATFTITVAPEEGGGKGGCSSSTDCAEQERCQNGQCVPENTECVDASDCLPGHVCEGGACVLDSVDSPWDFSGIAGTGKAVGLAIMAYLVFSQLIGVFEGPEKEYVIADSGGGGGSGGSETAEDAAE